MDDVISKLAEIEAAASRIMENVAEQKKVLSLENEEKMKAFDEETDKETEKKLNKIKSELQIHMEKELEEQRKKTEEVLEKIVDVIKGLPFWLKPGVRSVSKDYIKFENGCTLKCAATSDTPATGSSLHLIIVDEAALVPQSRMTPFWQSIYPTMSSSNIAQIIVLSTPRGKHNLFYDLIASSDMTYKRDDPRWNGFTYKRVDYWQVPGHDTEEWKQRQIAVFGEANFNQEFGLSFESDASKLVSPTDLKWMNDNKQKFISVDIYGIPYNVSSKIFWHICDLFYLSNRQITNQG